MKYYASEIKPEAIFVTMDNHPETKQIGDVRKIRITDLPKIDLLIGGSPCQDLSIAMKNREGLNGSKSSLFFEYIRLLKEVKPTYFLLENVGRMSNEDKEIITSLIGVEPIRINSSLVSAQLRDRYYWTNIPGVQQPIDRKIKFKDILISGYTKREKSRAIKESESRPLINKERLVHRFKTTGMQTIVFEDEDFKTESCRILNQIELERLQTLPDGYTKVLNRNKAAGVIGDGWTVEVIKHIFNNLPTEILFKKDLNVLSLFDGISCGQQALKDCRGGKYSSNVKCKYCDREAVRVSYRSRNGQVNKEKVCEKCHLTTNEGLDSLMSGEKAK